MRTPDPHCLTCDGTGWEVENGFHMVPCSVCFPSLWVRVRSWWKKKGGDR